MPHDDSDSFVLEAEGSYSNLRSGKQDLCSKKDTSLIQIAEEHKGSNLVTARKTLMRRSLKTPRQA